MSYQIPTFKLKHKLFKREAILIGFGPIPCECKWWKRLYFCLIGR